MIGFNVSRKLSMLDEKNVTMDDVISATMRALYETAAVVAVAGFAVLVLAAIMNSNVCAGS
jgi:hypothetical protein